MGSWLFVLEEGIELLTNSFKKRASKRSTRYGKRLGRFLMILTGCQRRCRKQIINKDAQPALLLREQWPNWKRKPLQEREVLQERPPALKRINEKRKKFKMQVNPEVKSNHTTTLHLVHQQILLSLPQNPPPLRPRPRLLSQERLAPRTKSKI